LNYRYYYYSSDDERRRRGEDENNEYDVDVEVENGCRQAGEKVVRRSEKGIGNK
jgi:hypothetical protein